MIPPPFEKGAYMNMYQNLLNGSSVLDLQIGSSILVLQTMPQWITCFRYVGMDVKNNFLGSGVTELKDAHF